MQEERLIGRLLEVVDVFRLVSNSETWGYVELMMGLYVWLVARSESGNTLPVHSRRGVECLRMASSRYAIDPWLMTVLQFEGLNKDEQTFADVVTEAMRAAASKVNIGELKSKKLVFKDSEVPQPLRDRGALQDITRYKDVAGPDGGFFLAPEFYGELILGELYLV
ncbi:hypothetical protein P154DRAFT_624383 [Amniculicola lignicola CBS 123094]|uniref:Uncharacterized protein n=1 Tax=Amniculicola lignicola CBS 123094 TaxID=1392246 RepID=A0A6A5VYN5_9PLEO|nr:hypothetical protein P154DRAFT_624383 [Amniculicola lignicola CBS 123094]